MASCKKCGYPINSNPCVHDDEHYHKDCLADIESGCSNPQQLRSTVSVKATFMNIIQTKSPGILILIFLVLWAGAGVYAHIYSLYFVLGWFYSILAVILLIAIGGVCFLLYMLLDDDAPGWLIISILLLALFLASACYRAYDHGSIQFMASSITSSDKDEQLSVALSGVLNSEVKSDLARASRTLLVNSGDLGFSLLKTELNNEQELKSKKRLILALAAFNNVDGCSEIYKSFLFGDIENTETKDGFNQTLISTFAKFNCSKLLNTHLTGDLEKAHHFVSDLGNDKFSFSIQIDSEEGTGDSLSTIPDALKIIASLFGISAHEQKNPLERNLEINIIAKAIGGRFGKGYGHGYTSYSAADVAVSYKSLRNLVTKIEKKTVLPNSIGSLHVKSGKEDAPYNLAFPTSKFVQMTLCDIFHMYEYKSTHIAEITRWIFATDGAGYLTQKISEGDDSIDWQSSLRKNSLAILNDLADSKKGDAEKFRWRECG